MLRKYEPNMTNNAIFRNSGGVASYHAFRSTGAIS